MARQGVTMTIKLFWENSNPVPARTTKTLKSSWNFVPNAERKQTVSMYPIMITGAMGLAMHDFIAKKTQGKQLMAKAHRILAKNKMPQVVADKEK